jgi:hypothetical protein
VQSADGRAIHVTTERSGEVDVTALARQATAASANQFAVLGSSGTCSSEAPRPLLLRICIF